jgi:hypothetical protein
MGMARRSSFLIWLLLLIIVNSIVVSCKDEYTQTLPQESYMFGEWQSDDKNLSIRFTKGTCFFRNIPSSFSKDTSTAESIYSIHENGPHGGTFINVYKLDSYFYLLSNNRLELRLNSDPQVSIYFNKL